MADNKSPFKPVSPFKKSASPFARPGAAKKEANDALGNILSFGQTAIDTISTPLYFTSGLVSGMIDNAQGRTNDVLKKATDNAFAWQSGKKVETGRDILQKLGYLKPGTQGADAADSVGGFVSGLATDILLDPLTYTPAVLISAPLKVVATTGRAAVRAGNIARKGNVAAEVAAKAKNVEVSSLPVETIPTTAKPIIKEQLKKTEKIEVTSPRLRTKAAERSYARTREILERFAPKADTAANYKYQVTPINKAERGLAEAANQIVVSSLIAGRRAMADTVLSISAREWLIKRAKDAAKEAKLAGAVKAAALPFASYRALAPKAEQQAAEMTTAEAAVITSNSGETAEFKPYTPYEYDDATYVGDGKNIYKFDSPEAASTWIQETISPTPAPSIREVVVAKSGKTYNVSVNGEATRTFPTKKAADTYAETVRTGTRVQPVQPPVRRSGQPILDISQDPKVINEILAIKASDEDVAKAQKVLKTLDAIARKSSVTRSATSTEIAKKIRDILGLETVARQRLLRSITPDIWKRLSISLKNEIGYGPFDFLKELSTKGQWNTAINQLYRMILATRLKDGRTIGELYKSGIAFNKLSLDGSVQAQIADRLKNIVRLVNAGSIKNKSTILAEIEKIGGAQGAQLAKMVDESGFFDSLSDASIKKINAGLAKLDVAVEEVKPNSFDELVTGMRDKGYSVDSSSLISLLKAIDPDNQDLQKVSRVLGEDAKTLLSNILLNEGIQSVAKTRRLVDIAKDPNEIFNAVGIAYSDIAAAIVLNRVKNGYGPEDAALEAKNMYHTRQAAAERIENNWGQVLNQGRVTGGYPRWATAMSTALDARMEEIARLQNDPASLERITTLGDAALTNGLDPYEKGSEAILKLQLNQVFESRIFGSLNGTLTSREQKAAAANFDAATKNKKLRDKEKDFEALTAEERVNAYIEDMDKVRDGLLATMNGRIRQSKFRRDQDFAAKYEQKIYDNEPHFVFLDLGDIMRAFKETGRSDIMESAFYYIQKFETRGDVKADSFSTVGVGDMIRRALEIKEKEGIYNPEELVERAMTRSDKQPIPSDEFQNDYRTIATAMVNHVLNEPRVLQILEDLHKSRMVASITDSFNGAAALSEDIYTTLIDGYRANYSIGRSLSDAERKMLVKDNFRRFIFASNLMKLKGGDVAEAVFRTAGMAFIDGGKLRDLAAKTPHATLEDTQLIDNEEINEFLKNYYALRNTERASEIVPSGPVEPQITVGKKQREKIQADFDKAKYAYEEHMSRQPNLANDAERKRWEKNFDKLQAKLNETRFKARQIGLTTQHYMFGKWVDSAAYNQEKALKIAQETNLRYLATATGVEDRARFLTDTRPEMPKPKKLTKKQREALLQKLRLEDTKVQIEKQTENAQNAADSVLLDLEAGKFDELGLSDAEIGQRAIQETFARELTWNEMVVHTTYGARTGIRNKSVVDNLAKRVGERIYGPSGRWNTVQILHKAESTGINRVARFAEYLDALRKTYTGTVNLDDIADVWTSIVNDIDMPSGTDDALLTFRDDLKRATDLLIKSADESEFAAMGLDGFALESSMRKYGVTENKGIPPFSTNSSKGMVDWLRKLPFAKRPEDVLDGTEDAYQWAANAERFRESGEDPFLMLTRIMEAVEMSKTERVIALDFTTRFGWKAAGFKTIDEAINAGFVKIKAKGAQEGDLTRFIPSPEDGGLFPPELAEEFGSLMREYNELYNNRMPDWTKTVMEVQGFLKATQTILRAGHHVTNFVGDVGTAMIVGVRNPVHWSAGWRLTQKSRLSQSAIGEGDRRLDRLFGRAFRAFEGEGKAFQTVKDGKETLQFVLNVNGKPRKVDFADDDLISLFERRGIFISNIFANDIQGLADNIIADTAGPTASAFKKMSARFTSTARKIEKPAGDFAAWYGNATRAAHALKIMQSQAWDNIEDALDAAADAVNKFHPTVQSLSSTERKWPRFAFSYYTWLRVAHNAMLDMALNHTAAFTFYSKVQYNLAATQGMEPTSFGQPFEDKKQLPSYLSYSVFGPTSQGPRGGFLFKPAVLPLDVLDTWNISFDPRKTLEENAFKASGNVAQTLGKSINLIVQPGIEAATQTDLSTGKPLNINSVRDVADQMIGTLGFSTLLKGLNLYTPENKLPENTSNPITSRDRELNLINWLTGAKLRDTGAPADLRNAKSELSQRTKDWLLSQWEERQK